MNTSTGKKLANKMLLWKIMEKNATNVKNFGKK